MGNSQKLVSHTRQLPHRIPPYRMFCPLLESHTYIYKIDICDSYTGQACGKHVSHTGPPIPDVLSVIGNMFPIPDQTVRSESKDKFESEESSVFLFSIESNRFLVGQSKVEM